MRRFSRVLLAALSAALPALSASRALAQKDVQPKLPNVLLLVDNSGSMEYLMEPAGKLPGDPSAPNTACNGNKNLSARNRWANLVTALTGTIADSDFSCQAVPRSGAAFTNEFGTGTYDANYYLPFHRIYSTDCAFGAGQLPPIPPWNWWQLPSATGGKDFTYRLPNGSATPSCTFTQQNDGLLDAFRGLVRFGMMTLDTFPNPGTGSTPTGTPSSATADLVDGNKGMWSYFHNWIAGVPGAPGVSGTAVNTQRPGAGNPAGCATPSFFEVGARSPAAPPWEGRMVPFGDWNDDGHVPTTNDQIQMELLTTRSYGATPVAGLLDDAKEFLFGDTTTVPGQTYGFGPSDDDFWRFGCRKTFVILLSDGQPNMDMRSPAASVSGCDTSGAPTGVCPYDTADQIATDLRTAAPTPNQSVLTFVVGFTISDFNRMSPVPSVPSAATKCEDLDVSPTGTDCINPPAELRACCNLQKIALAGGTGRAYFADTQNKLKQALAAILSQVISGTTDRTWPVYAPAGNRQAQGTNFSGSPTASYQFAASFTVNSPSGASGGASALVPGLWKGRLLRERTSCPSSNVPTPQTVTPSSGDDFGYNLDLSDSSHPRKIFTVVADDDVDHDHWHHGTTHTVYSERSIRPYNTINEGVGLYKNNPTAPQTPANDTTWVSQMSSYPEAFGMPATAACNAAFGNGTTKNQCTQYITSWEVGLNNTSLPSTVLHHTRDWKNCLVPCSSPVGCQCAKLGAIFHSTPVVAGPPREFLRDETYTNYANGTFAPYGGTGQVAQQPTVLYTATMDGQLHAFKVQANDPADSETTDKAQNNELWSFVPPAVLKKLLPNYNTGGVPLLDGAPVVADVPGEVYTVTDIPKIRRTSTSAVQWHRVLVAGGGKGGGFYYALDVTIPTKPRFLWQLSTDWDKGDPMFGSYVPTPAITIVNVTINGTTQQVPVAILPGGGTDSMVAHCASSLKSIPSSDSDALVNDASNAHLLPGVIASPPDLRCWDMKKNSNRSTGNALYVARLDTGQLLAAFQGQKFRGGPNDDYAPDDNDDDDHHGHHHNNGAIDITYDAPFRAPLTGVPVPYPGETGQVSDRVYVGDADGVLWRLDMSNPDVSQWRIKQVWDSYVDDSASSSGSIREGISITPIISRDAIGNPVILIATGDQDNFNRQPKTNHIWSLTENPSTKKVSPNWHIALPQYGPRVTGPMALFNSSLYFATFLPQAPGGNPCSDGFASVWGVDFIRRGSSSVSGGVPAGLSPVSGVWPLPQFPTTGAGTVYGYDAAPRTIIMGISVGETPTCDTQIVSSDPYFGSHTALSGVSGSNYQIMWQTGAGTGVSGSGTAVKNSSTVPGVQFIQPPPPGQGTRIDSWASIVD
jgi:type IV pilus assembly protein PilY1